MIDNLRKTGGFHVDLQSLHDRQIELMSLAVKFYRVSKIASDANIIRVRFHLHELQNWEGRTGREFIDIFRTAAQACGSKNVWEMQYSPDDDEMSFFISDPSFADEILTKIQP